MKVQLFLAKDEPDYKGNIWNEDRYIVLDDNGMDEYGEHFPLEQAEKLILTEDVAEDEAPRTHKENDYWVLSRSAGRQRGIIAIRTTPLKAVRKSLELFPGNITLGIERLNK